MRRTGKQIVDEAIAKLSVEPLTITQLMSEINVNHVKIKQVIQELEERGITRSFEKKARWGKLCTHYKVILPLNRLRQ